MASIWLPSAGDQENVIRLPGATKGKAFNKLSQRGPVAGKKMLATPQKGLSLPLQQQGLTGRTFGDISNLLADRGAAITPARAVKPPNKGYSVTKKSVASKPQQPAPVSRLISKTTPVPVKPADAERDFFPKIDEIEDYTDVLPSALLLEEEDVQRIVKQWQLLQLPSRPHSPPQSPPPSPSRLLLDDTYCLPSHRPLQPCGLQAAEEFSEVQLMPVDW